MRFEPLEDRVLIERVEADYKGLIVIPDQHKEKPQLGLVVAIGGGHYHEGELVPPLVKPGDKIMFGKYSGTDLKIDGRELIIMREGDILGIVHEDQQQLSS